MNPENPPKPKCKRCEEKKDWLGRLKHPFYFVYNEGIRTMRTTEHWGPLDMYFPAEEYKVQAYSCSNDHDWSERLPEPPQEESKPEDNPSTS